MAEVKVKKRVKRKGETVESQKPVSAYALFFREKQTQIKTMSADISFGEVSKLVAYDWDRMTCNEKATYKRKADEEKQNYLKKLATYKAMVVAGYCGQEEERNGIKEEDDQTQANGMLQKVNSEANLDTSAEIRSDECSYQALDLNNFATMTDSFAGQVDENQTFTTSPPKCIRSECNNLSVANADWDREYCSAECTVIHCKEVFESFFGSISNMSNIDQRPTHTQLGNP